MSVSKPLATVRSVTLTLGAVLGVVCLLWTVGVAIAGVRPLVFESGSMSPTIHTGDLAFAKTIPADEVEVGDVVSVKTDDDERITHRVVSVTPDGAATTLLLQGDANNTPDAQPYTVTEVDLVVGHVPMLGYVLAFASSPVGMAMGGLLLVASVGFGFFGGSSPPGERAEPPRERAVSRRALTRERQVLVVVLFSALLAGSAVSPVHPTMAYFTDTPKLTSPVDGLDAARWFTCAQATSQATYGSAPWAHLNFNENTGLPQLSTTDPYFQDDSGGDWDGIYYVGNVWSAMIPSGGHTPACNRDPESKSVYLQGNTLLTSEFVRLNKNSQAVNGPAGARWNTFTVNVWFKTDITALDDKAGALAAYSRASGTESLATDRVLYLDSSGRLTFEVYPGAYHFRATTASYADNKWHMATATLGPTGQCLYIDGQPAGGCDTTVTSAYQTSFAMYWRFGYAEMSNGFQGITDGSVEQRAFKGYLDDAAIWTRQLSETEIIALHRAGLPVRT